MSEIDSEIIKNTQKSLGEYFKKPPLTEKLLSRPPFRFLHDIVTSVINNSGFMRGLFTDQELNSDNVKEKGAKIIFLKKLIGIVSLVLNTHINVNPVSIVAGKEAENTNFLLQSLAKAISKKVDNNVYVKKTLSGEAEKLLNLKLVNNNEIKPLEKKKTVSDKANPSVRTTVKGDVNIDSDEVQNNILNSIEKKKGIEKIDEEKSKEKNKLVEEKSIKKQKKDKLENESTIDKETKEQGRSFKNKSEKRKSEVPRVSEESNEKQVLPRTLEAKSESPPTFDNDIDSSKRLARPSSAKGTRHRHENQSILNDDKENEKSKSIMRPPSARPAPPKVRKSSEAGVDDGLNSQTKVTGLIIDVDRDSDDGDYVVEEYVGGGDIDVKFSHANMNTNLDEGEKHGALVQSIIQSKKEFKSNEVDISAHSDIQKKRERLSTEKEIDKIRHNLQALTKSINPLGKLIDFIQEDLDTMQKESDKWCSEHDELQKALQLEKNVTNKVLKPIKEKLDDQNKIKLEQEEAISKLKANIEKNSTKIETILLSSCSIRT